MTQNENSWTWTCADQSEDKPVATMFACRFTKKENVAKFEETFNQSFADNAKLGWGEKTETKENTETEEKPKEEEAKAE